MKKKLIILLKEVLALLFVQASNLKTELVYAFAKKCIGKDMAPIHDEYGCAEAVNNVVQQVLKYPVGGDVSTYRMYEELKKSTKFKRVDIPTRGVVVLSPTGFGSGRIANGHVGIMSDYGKIMSNNSATALWDEHWTLDKWKKHYGEEGGFPVLFYKPV